MEDSQSHFQRHRSNDYRLINVKLHVLYTGFVVFRFYIDQSMWNLAIYEFNSIV